MIYSPLVQVGQEAVGSLKWCFTLTKRFQPTDEAGLNSQDSLFVEVTLWRLKRGR